MNRISSIGRALTVVVVAAMMASFAPPARSAPRERVLIVGHYVDPDHLNPAETTAAAFETVVAAITEKLMSYSADTSTINPGLATSWKWLDRDTLEMELRRGVNFTNGEPFDAAAAKFTIDTFAKAPRYRVLLPADVYKETEIVNDSRIRVHLNRPYYPFLSFLARGSYVLPPKYYAQVGPSGFGRAPIGTGPFVLSNWVRDSQIELTRNPNYWGGPHPISRVVFRIMPEATARVAALEAGEIHIALLLPVSAIERLRRKSNVEVISYPGLRKFSVYFDTKFGVGSPKALRDPRVRLALNLAVDKLAIKDKLFQGQAEVLEGQYQTRAEVGFNPSIKMFPYDPGRARQLLAQAGYPQGFDLQFTYTIGAYPLDKEVNELITSYWRAIGVNVIPRALEFGTWVRLFDERTIGTHFVGALQPPEPLINFAKYMDNRFEFHVLKQRGELRDLLRKAAGEFDQTKRTTLFKRMSEIAYEDPPMLYLYVPRDIYAVDNRVKNFGARADQILWLYDIDLND